ncbi:MAG TPA: LamG domain-containing protein, partial [Clostridia bacterium]|nr:LamG domain-containing protein [Clostridia bacterium]
MLTHRYSFSTNADDLIGTAHGSLQGDAKCLNGAAHLDGTNSSIILPPNLVDDYDSISFEMWYTDFGGYGINTPYLLSFSTVTNRLVAGIFLDTTGRGRFSQVNGNTQQTLGFGGRLLPVERVNHLVWTQDKDSQTTCIYLDGLLVAQRTNHTLTPALVGPTLDNRLGSLTNGFGGLTGFIDEFRIYRGALSSLEVAVSAANGPDRPWIAPETLSRIQLKPSRPAGPGALVPLTVLADFGTASNVNLMGQADLVIESSDTNVLVVKSNNRVLALAPETATLTAHYQGVSDSNSVTVPYPQSFRLLHRYSFDEPLNSNVVHDSVGNAHGRVMWRPASTDFTGTGQLKLSNGYVDLGSGIISSLSEVSVEAWVNWLTLQ